jgi:hypothetical protein
MGLAKETQKFVVHDVPAGSEGKIADELVASLEEFIEAKIDFIMEGSWLLGQQHAAKIQGLRAELVLQIMDILRSIKR